MIAKAKVPIIKFETADFGGLAFDISFDVPNGPQAAVLVKEVIGEWMVTRTHTHRQILSLSLSHTHTL